MPSETPDQFNDLRHAHARSMEALLRLQAKGLSPEAQAAWAEASAAFLDAQDHHRLALAVSKAAERVWHGFGAWQQCRGTADEDEYTGRLEADVDAMHAAMMRLRFGPKDDQGDDEEIQF